MQVHVDPSMQIPSLAPENTPWAFFANALVISPGLFLALRRLQKRNQLRAVDVVVNDTYTVPGSATSPQLFQQPDETNTESAPYRHLEQ